MPSKSTSKAEFGDFQTPPALAQEVCALLRPRLGPMRAIVEPTCGLGNLMVGAQQYFPEAQRLLGVERNHRYLEQARQRLQGCVPVKPLLLHADAFSLPWCQMMGQLPRPLLVLGNPPWVTSAELGALESENLPPKANTAGHSGLDALMGKSNFDVSQWLALRLLEAMPEREAHLALLVKSAVARKIIRFAWTKGLALTRSEMFLIDAPRLFSARVDACLLLLSKGESAEKLCPVYESLAAKRMQTTITIEQGELIADRSAFQSSSGLVATAAPKLNWRSGIKHDCAKILELRPRGSALVNGYQESVLVEPQYLYPLQKSSDVASGRGDRGKKIIVTQRRVGAPTEGLEQQAPRLWEYLQAHREGFERRKSSIYRGRPVFSIFGVGDYSFAPWKVAISALYKKIHFELQGPVSDKAVMYDDTVYFLGFRSQHQARRVHQLLQSSEAQDFYRSYIFWDDKRPITAGLLRRLDLERLQKKLQERA